MLHITGDAEPPLRAVTVEQGAFTGTHCPTHVQVRVILSLSVHCCCETRSPQKPARVREGQEGKAKGLAIISFVHLHVHITHMHINTQDGSFLSLCLHRCPVHGKAVTRRGHRLGVWWQSGSASSPVWQFSGGEWCCNNSNGLTDCRMIDMWQDTWQDVIMLLCYYDMWQDMWQSGSAGGPVWQSSGGE